MKNKLSKINTPIENLMLFNSIKNINKSLPKHKLEI